MAGRKVFTSGEILTAADVNSFLMDQSVMVFADSSARSSAIPSPTEGMITYLEDTDAVEKYDGAAFVNVAPGGLVAVKSALKTDVFSASIAIGETAVVTDMEITHAVSDSSNKVILSGVIHAAMSTGSRLGILVTADGTAIAVGDSAASRPSISFGGGPAAVSGQGNIGYEIVYSPGSTSSVTYDIRLIGTRLSTTTFYVNRTAEDANTAEFSRAVSSLTLQEVAV